MDEQSQPEDKKDKKPRGKYGMPRLALKKTLELVDAVNELGYGDAVPRAEALDKIHRKPVSGSSSTLVGAAAAYGLLKSSDGKLQLTERGKQLTDPNATESQKQRAILDGLFSDEMFTAFMSRHEGKGILPADRTAILYFKQNHELSEEDAKSYWEVTKTNLSDYGLVRESETGTKLLQSRASVEAKFPEEKIELETREAVEKPEQSVAATAPTPVAPSPISVPTDIVPEFHFNIQIHLPPDAAPDKYDAIFKSIAIHLLGRTDKEQ